MLYLLLFYYLLPLSIGGEGVGERGAAYDILN
jgi:hypothetical protein